MVFEGVLDVEGSHHRALKLHIKVSNSRYVTCEVIFQSLWSKKILKGWEAELPFACTLNTHCAGQEKRKVWAALKVLTIIVIGSWVQKCLITDISLRNPCFMKDSACVPLEGELSKYTASFLWIFLNKRGLQVYNGKRRGRKINLSKTDAFKLLPHVWEEAVWQQTTSQLYSF